jgi:hypothetical protein
MIKQLPIDGLDKSLGCILGECAAGLAEFGSTRPELILLTLHSLAIALRQCHSLVDPNLKD